MKPVSRTFTDEVAVRGDIPLMIGLAGFAGSGKTLSALKLAAGVQRVVGGDIYGIDTEDGRMRQYAGRVKFRHVPFAPPHGPVDYCAAIEHCLNKGAKVIVIDSMSDEHEGEGGILDQHEKYLDQKAGNDWGARARYAQVGWAMIKPQRKQLERFVDRHKRDAVFILCYRAEEKMKFEKGKDPTNIGQQIKSTSKFIYQCTVRWLLRPGADGVPTVQGETTAESMLIKNPEDFRGWFRGNEPINEELGEKLARFCKGDAPQAASAGQTKSVAKAPAGTQPQAPASGSSDFKLRFSKGYLPELRGKPLEIASMEQIAAYQQYLQEILDDPAKANFHDDVSKLKEQVDTYLDQIRAEEAMGGATDGDEEAA